tara:strand:+ start:4562 stop:5374 length:813 start_codon:yes stop_codon:yes gene_type:complete
MILTARNFASTMALMLIVITMPGCSEPTVELVDDGTALSEHSIEVLRRRQDAFGVQCINQALRDVVNSEGLAGVGGLTSAELNTRWQQVIRERLAELEVIDRERADMRQSAELRAERARSIINDLLVTSVRSPRNRRDVAFPTFIVENHSSVTIFALRVSIKVGPPSRPVPWAESVNDLPLIGGIAPGEQREVLALPAARDSFNFTSLQVPDAAFDHILIQIEDISLAARAFELETARVAVSGAQAPAARLLFLRSSQRTAAACQEDFLN